MPGDCPGEEDFEERNQETARTAIRDAEVAQIAVFKLRECASRLETLASVDSDSPFSKDLRDVVAELRQMEIALLRHVRGRE